MKRYSLVIEKTETGYSAYSPDVDGCAAVGVTEQETRENFREALALHLEAVQDIGESTEPRPQGSGSSGVSYL